MHDLQRTLNPGSIVVIGGREAEQLVHQCHQLGFDGEIWAVNPFRSHLGGVRCVKNLQSLPGTPDVAFIAIPAQPTIETVHQLSTMGAGGAICYASGFREVGAADLHQKLLDAAGEMPIIGPNCYGYINALSGAALWPDQHGLSRVSSGVAIFSSSGNVSINMTMQQRSLSIAMIVTIGNQAMIGIEHCIEAVLDDDRITAIGLHIEGLNNLPLFTELAKKAAGKNKPIIALKTGRSTIGARITLSHTATLAGANGLYDQLFSRLGVAQVNNLEEFLEALKLVSITGPLVGNKIASMSCSGGEASLIADLAVGLDIEFPQLTEGHKQLVQDTLNEYVNVDNPLDYHTFIWADRHRMENTFRAMLQGGFDLTVLVLDFPRVTQCDIEEWIDAANAFINVCEQSGCKGAIISSLGENLPTSVRDQLITGGVTPLLGMSQGLAAIQAAASVCRIDKPLPELRTIATGGESVNTVSLSEYDAKQLLSTYGLSVAPSHKVQTVADAVAAAQEIGYPVVLKAGGSTLAHKTEFEAVRLNISTGDGVQQNAQQLIEIGEHILVEKMITDGVAELLLGVGYDEFFGHYLIIGFGGTLVELIADRQLLLLPVSDNQISAAIHNLRTVKVLQGHRGNSPGDIAAVIKSVQQLATFVEDNRELLLEVDINPLIVGAVGSGATVADALILNRAVGE